MAGFTVPISTAVHRLSSSISFFQPFIEAVTNSLEANASQISIDVNFDRQKLLIDNEEKYVFKSLSVTDNGEGFTDENIRSFLTYMSEHKVALGCKGIGRITWLKVFSLIKIKSYIQNKDIEITFDENFSDKNIQEIENERKQETKTIIEFLNIKKEYNTATYSSVNEFIDAVKNRILSSLFVKLFLLDQEGRKFTIAISDTVSRYSTSISNCDIQKLLCKDFSIENNSKKFIFHCYYTFNEDNSLKNKIFYCANGRTVAAYKKSGIYIETPKNNSAIFFITSPYFDEKVNDERNAFKIDDSSLVDDLSWNSITPHIQKIIDDIIIQKFPYIKENNKRIVSEAEDEYPYLTPYFNKDKSKIKNKEKLIENAKKAFEREKNEIHNRFKNILKNRKIDTDEFDKAISDISEIASRELAEYIVYRQQIIYALELMNETNEKSEEKIHNIFMKKHTESKNNESYDNNLWLFDDKYMTYIYAASDIQIRQYSNALEEIAKELNTLYRPDLAVFFSNKGNCQKDALVVEFKSCGASSDEKSKSFWEINRNAQAIRESIGNIDRMWCYTITKFDDKFIKNIESQDFSPLFTNSKNKEVYYRYFSKINAHCYYISLEALLADANSRNKIFLDIIRKNNKK